MMKRFGGPSLKPVNSTRPRDDLHFGTAFVQQCGRLERALASTDHHQLLAGKPAQVAVFGRVPGQRRREALKLRRTPGERTDADSDNDTARPDHVAICKDDSEARRTGFDAGNLPLIEVGYRLALIP